MKVKLRNLLKKLSKAFDKRNTNNKNCVEILQVVETFK